MSLRIVTTDEAKIMQEVAKKHGELCDVRIGPALRDYICDNSGEVIPAGTMCAAVILLPDDSHPNYEHQRRMMADFVGEI